MKAAVARTEDIIKAASTDIENSIMASVEESIASLNATFKRSMEKMTTFIKALEASTQRQLIMLKNEVQRLSVSIAHGGQETVTVSSDSGED